MKKEEALKIVLACSKQYKSNLENQNYMFVFDKDKNQRGFFEASFYPRNFLHLTGLKLVNFKSSVEFYEACIANRLSINDFNLSSDGTTILKLQVLPAIMELHKTAKMIGVYNNTNINLNTDRIAGSINACLGFVNQNGYYVPNTVLKEDVRKLVNKKANRIIAIYSKSIESEFYSKLRYIGKGITFEELNVPEEIIHKIAIDKFMN